MIRSQVLQSFIDLQRDKTYLEIGVEGGRTFHAIQAAKKVAVDPIFRFALPATLVTSEVEYHQITSDSYFEKAKLEDRFGVIYLDGLHTVEQTLRDLLNAIERLHPGGVIVIDDVLPSSWAASLDLQSDAAFVRNRLASERFDGESWMGPVFRVVYFVAAFMQSYEYATVQDNHGQLVMWRRPRRFDEKFDLTVERAVRMDLVDVFKDNSVFRIMPLAEIIKLYESSVAGG
jgi:predicted O-methyltransferase YrrM